MSKTLVLEARFFSHGLAAARASVFGYLFIGLDSFKGAAMNRSISTGVLYFMNRDLRVASLSMLCSTSRICRPPRSENRMAIL